MLGRWYAITELSLQSIEYVRGFCKDVFVIEEMTKIITCEAVKKPWF